MLARFSHARTLLAAFGVAAMALSAMANPPTDQMIQRSYAVADLVVPLERAEGSPARKVGNMEKPPKRQDTLENRLIQLITKSVKPASWAGRGGSATIDYFPLGMTLVINQTTDAHERIADLLAQLRRQQDIEVALEVRFLTMSEDFSQRLDRELDIQVVSRDGSFVPPAIPVRSPVNGEEKVTGQDLGPKFLSDAQLRRIMETAQGDRRANVMQAPKVTLMNGQVGRVDITDARLFLTGVDVVRTREQTMVRPKNEPTITGLRMTAQPVVSADRRFVHLYLNIDQTDLASATVPLTPVEIPVHDNAGESHRFKVYLQQPQLVKQAIEKTVAIPDGGTVVFGAFKKLIETRYESAPPVLGDIPYVNRLFKNVAYGRESQLVLVLVTPRIIVNEEREAQPLAAGRQANPVPEPCTAAVSAAPATAADQARIAKSLQTAGQVQEVPEPLAAVSQRQGQVVAQLLQAYSEACALGRHEEAAKFAQAALAIDPTCFHSKR
jgi:general secretion pathway protein D